MTTISEPTVKSSRDNLALHRCANKRNARCLTCLLHLRKSFFFYYSRPSFVQLTIGFSARSSEMLLLEQSLLSLVEQLLRCGRNGLVLPTSMIECVATEIDTRQALKDFSEISSLNLRNSSGLLLLTTRNT